MIKEQAERIVHLIESTDQDNELVHFSNRCSAADVHLSDVLIMALEKKWSLDELVDVAELIIKLQD